MPITGSSGLELALAGHGTPVSAHPSLKSSKYHTSHFSGTPPRDLVPFKACAATKRPSTTPSPDFLFPFSPSTFFSPLIFFLLTSPPLGLLSQQWLGSTPLRCSAPPHQLRLFANAKPRISARGSISSFPELPKLPLPRPMALPRASRRTARSGERPGLC